MTAVATILTIGDELIAGSRIDTNGPWLSNQLLRIGITTSQRCVCSDSVASIAQSILELSAKSDLLLITGGLGPTKDDRTREGLALALGDSLVVDDDAMASVEAWFSSRGLEMPEPNQSQAKRPTTATWIPNSRGTAPSLQATCNTCLVFCLPGPPIEMTEIFESIQDTLVNTLDCSKPIYSTEIHSWGMAESIAGEAIKEYMEGEDACVSVLMSDSGITAKVTSSDKLQLQQVVEEIQDRWSPWVYGIDGETLASAVSALVLDKRNNIATAESCTGGLLSDALVHEAGASDWFLGGFVTYTNELKRLELGVPSELISECGAVSCEVARAMSEGVCHQTGSEIGLSTTGIAGPTGGTEEKPVGTVYIGCTVQGQTEVKHFCFSGTRTQIRKRSVQSALQMFRLTLLGLDNQTMCWQRGESISATS